MTILGERKFTKSARIYNFTMTIQTRCIMDMGSAIVDADIIYTKVISIMYNNLMQFNFGITHFSFGHSISPISQHNYNLLHD